MWTKLLISLTKLINLIPDIVDQIDQWLKASKNGTGAVATPSGTQAAQPANEMETNSPVSVAQLSGDGSAGDQPPDTEAAEQVESEEKSQDGMPGPQSPTSSATSQTHSRNRPPASETPTRSLIGDTIARLRRFYSSVVGFIMRNKLLTAVAVLLILLISASSGRIVILPFTTGQIESTSLGDGAAIANQLIAEINQIGVGNPAPSLTLRQLGEPSTLIGGQGDEPVIVKITETGGEESFVVSEQACKEVLFGPEFVVPDNQSIYFQRAQNFGSQDSRLDIEGLVSGLSLGSINVPTQLFTEVIIKTLPINYREITGQVIESGEDVEISMSITEHRGLNFWREPQTSDQKQTWRVQGPSDAYPEMMEYLAVRIMLHLEPLLQASGLKADELSDWQLAFAMGTEAFIQGRYQRASAFLEIADRYESSIPSVDAMRALAYYHLSDEDNSAPALKTEALQAMEVAVRQATEDNRMLLRPYLACLHYVNGQRSEAETQAAIFNATLAAQRVKNAPLLSASALNKLPVRGPGKRLFADNGFIAFVDEGGRIAIALDAELIGRPLAAKSRQLQIYEGESLLFVTENGSVAHRTLNPSTSGENEIRVLFAGDAIEGVQQVSLGLQGRLFILNRFGKVYNCQLTNPLTYCVPKLMFQGTASEEESAETNLVAERSLTNVRQVFAAGKTLYMLAEDGSVWTVQILDNSLEEGKKFGEGLLPRVLTDPAQVQEIFVIKDESTGRHALYLLHGNGNVWRYIDDGVPGNDDLTLIDGGTGTSQIFAHESQLYLLKSSGVLWRIDNASKPGEEEFVELILPADIPEGDLVREIFVARGSADESDETYLYLITSQGRLWRALDVGAGGAASGWTPMPAQ